MLRRSATAQDLHALSASAAAAGGAAAACLMIMNTVGKIDGRGMLQVENSSALLKGSEWEPSPVLPSVLLQSPQSAVNRILSSTTTGTNLVMPSSISKQNIMDHQMLSAISSCVMRSTFT